MNDIDKLVEILPEDLKNHIYRDFILLKEECDFLLNWYNENYRLDKPISDVEEITNKLLKNKMSIEYLRYKNNSFDVSYDIHFIQNKKSFDLMNITNSFTASVVMYMWH